MGRLGRTVVTLRSVIAELEQLAREHQDPRAREACRRARGAMREVLARLRERAEGGAPQPTGAEEEDR